MDEKSHMYCAKTTVGVRKIVSDGLSETLVGTLPYWAIWVSTAEKNIGYSDKSEAHLWRFFFSQVYFFQPSKFFPGVPFRPVGGGCDRTLRTPPPSLRAC